MFAKDKTLIAGCACGVLCALCVGGYVFSVHDEVKTAQADALAKYGGEQVQVCVAKHDLAAGQTIAESDIEERLWVATLLPADAVTNRKDAVGKQLGSTVLSGEVVSAARFGREQSSVDVPDGMYAVSVPAREVQAVGGALQPGSKTDVYSIGGNGAKRIAASVLVLATSSAKDVKTNDADAWITLALPPSRVQEIVQAADGLTLYFALPSKSVSEANITQPSDQVRRHMTANQEEQEERQPKTQEPAQDGEDAS